MAENIYQILDGYTKRIVYDLPAEGFPFQARRVPQRLTSLYSDPMVIIGTHPHLPQITLTDALFIDGYDEEMYPLELQGQVLPGHGLGKDIICLNPELPTSLDQDEYHRRSLRLLTQVRNALQDSKEVLLWSRAENCFVEPPDED